MRRTAAYILMIFMAMQVILGSLFFLTNFMSVQGFQENLFLPVPAGIIYLFQIAISAAAAWYLLKVIMPIENRFLKGFMTAYLLTVPFLLQFHMAKLTLSLALSAFLWMLGLAIETCRSGLTRKRGILLALSFFLYGLLCPDGLWLGGIVLITVFIFYWRMKKKIYCLLLIFGTAFLIFFANLSLNAIYPDGRKEYRYNSFGYIMASRFIWPNFATSYEFWGEEIKEIMPLEDAVEISQRADLLETRFFPMLEKNFGRKSANIKCLEMTHNCLRYRTREIVTEIVKDFKDYLMMPFTIEQNLKGENASLTGWNYGRMSAHTPLLVKYYYRYGSFELPVLLMASILLRLTGRNDSIRKDGGIFSIKISKEWKLLTVIVFIYAFWHTMRSNIPVDYKQALPLIFIWYLAAAAGISRVPFVMGDKDAGTKEKKSYAE